MTQILTYAAQASHELVPSDVLEPVIMAIANNFVSERSSPESIIVGLVMMIRPHIHAEFSYFLSINTIREVCSRCPLAMTEALLEDLCEYKANKHKGVTMAARSIIQLFREANPDLLPRRERGKPGEAHDPDAKVREYGEQAVNKFVPGSELLSMQEDLKADNPDAEEAEDEEGGAWESASEDSDDDDEFVAP